MSLYRPGTGIYTQSSETAVEDNVITAVYDIEQASTLMEAIVKIQGKRDIQNAGFGLMSNDGTSQSCSTSVVYSAYDDVMVITIRPSVSNSIGGPGNTWQIYGDLVVDGVAMDLDIKPTYSGHAVSSTPALPAEIGDYDSRMSVTTDTATTAASVGENVGSVTINGITYGLYIKERGSTIDFEIKENEGSTPLPIIVLGLNAFGQRIELYKTDTNTYVMSAINLVWATEPTSIVVHTSPALPFTQTSTSETRLECEKGDGTSMTDSDFQNLKIIVDGVVCTVQSTGSEYQYYKEVGRPPIARKPSQTITDENFYLMLSGTGMTGGEYTISSIVIG